MNKSINLFAGYFLVVVFTLCAMFYTYIKEPDAIMTLLSAIVAIICLKYTIEEYRHLNPEKTIKNSNLKIGDIAVITEVPNHEKNQYNVGDFAVIKDLVAVSAGLWTCELISYRNYVVKNIKRIREDDMRKATPNEIEEFLATLIKAVPG